MPTIEDGRSAIEKGNLQQARLIFEAILQDTPRSEQAWLGLAEVLTDTEDKRICYENVLKINKNNPDAKEGLRNLEPQANPLVAALAQQTVRDTAEEAEEVDDDGDDDATLVSTRVDVSPPTESGDGPSTVVLIAVGLALSVIVFAVGGGLVFFLITRLSG
jgi:thioredoxin-like negative regulator of GroEL